MNGNTEAWDIKNIELLEEYRSGSIEARDKLIMNNQGLINKIAKQYSFNGKYELEDLVQEGNIGLIKAIEKYDNTYDAAFSTYAVIWIKQSITRYIHNTGRAIRIPVHTQQRLIELDKTIKGLELKLGEEPSIYKIAKAMDISITEVQKLLIIRQDVASLDVPIGGEDEDITLLDAIQAEGKTPEEIVEEKDTACIIKKAIGENLEEKQQKIILLRYGFYGETQTLRNIGDIMDLSTEIVRQDEAKALRQLRRCPQIKTLWVEKRLDIITDFHRKTENVVLWREKQREGMPNKHDNTFYKWARKLKPFKCPGSSFDNAYGTNLLEEQEKAVAVFKSAMTKVLVSKDYKSYDILKRRIEGVPEEDLRKHYKYLSLDEYDYYEAMGIEYVSNYLKSYGIEIGL